MCLAPHVSTSAGLNRSLRYLYPSLCVFARAVCAENQTSDQALSSPSSLGSPGLGMEGLNRRRKKRTSIETNIRVALEKSFLEVSDIFC